MTDLIKQEADFGENMLKGKYLTFSIGSESYGIEVKYVIEIVGIQSITEMPEFPDYVKGVINLRGKIIPVIDVRLRFRKEPRDYDDRTCIIVIDCRDSLIGLIVDAVAEVINIPEEEIIDAPQLNSGQNGRFINKIGKVGNDIKLLIDCEQLLNQDELLEITQII